jgi:hypothetical protein
MPVQFVRLPYDIETVTDAMRRSELPDELAADLERGGTLTSTRRRDGPA